MGDDAESSLASPPVPASFCDGRTVEMNDKENSYVDWLICVKSKNLKSSYFFVGKLIFWAICPVELN